MHKVLIVEDEGILAYKAELDLQRMGYEVVGIADNGDEAIEAARQQRPDIILMDIVLKGRLSGIEIAGMIGECMTCRIIFMTAHTDAATIAAAKSTRHAGFLHKPFVPAQLKAAIEQALLH